MFDLINFISAFFHISASLIAFNWLFLVKTQFVDRFFYKQIDQIINEKNSHNWPGYHLFHGIYFALYTFGIIRVGRVAYSMKYYYSSPDILEYDFVYYFLRQFTSPSDQYFIYFVICFFAYFFIMEMLLFYRRTDTITWQKYHNLAIQNADAYKRCLVKKLSAKQNKNTIKLNRYQFMATKLTHFPNLSYHTRLLFIKRISLVDRFCQVTCILLGIFCCKFF